MTQHTSEDPPRRSALLEAALAGWGVTLRYAFLVLLLSGVLLASLGVGPAALDQLTRFVGSVAPPNSKE